MFKTQTNTTTEFRFAGSYPYGAVLSEHEKPTSSDRYAIKSDAGYIATRILDSVKKRISNTAKQISRKIGIDTSINKDMKIWSRGQTHENTKWGDLPAKIKYASGREVDVYPNSAEYKQLGDTITPTTRDVPTLEVHMKNNTTLVFFGGGIDLPEVDTPYNALLNAYNALNALKEKKKTVFSIPRPSVRLLHKNETESNLPMPSEPVQSLQEDNTVVKQEVK